MTATKPTTITATYRIVTPMFCAGAKRLGPNLLEPELRPASFKGALRFWWRAAHWGIYFSSAKSDSDALLQLRDQEDITFGSTRSGQANCRLALQWHSPASQDSEFVRDWPLNRGTGGSTYLGYGITESGRKNKGDYKPHREGLPTDRLFNVTLRFSRFANNEQIESVKRSLRLLGTIGGLGSRSRRGFGSLCLDQLDGESMVPESVNAIQQSLLKLVPAASQTAEFPAITAFSDHSRIAFLEEGTDRFAVHEQLGTAYRDFRGQPGSLRGAVKIPLGLPLKGVDESNRRSSPLLMHIHKVGNRFVPSILYLPSRFHPDIAHSDRIEYFDVPALWMTQLKGTSI